MTEREDDPPVDSPGAQTTVVVKTDAGSDAYEVLRTLGQGGQGRVVHAKKIGALGQEFAIKLLAASPDDPHWEQRLARFKDESKILREMRHPNIVSVIDLRRLDGQWSIIMEYVPGLTLSQVIRRGPMEPGPALEIAEGAADALRYAYKTRFVLHRDVKPANLRLTPEGYVKVFDFGIGWAAIEDRESPTTTHLMLTPNYAAPERFRFQDSHQADVFSLGIVLFNLLTGSQLWRDNQQVVPEGHQSGLDNARRRLVDEGFGDPLVQLVCSMLHYQPTERPDAGTVKRQAEQIRATLGGPSLAAWVESRASWFDAPPSIPSDDPMAGRILHAAAITVPTPPPSPEPASKGRRFHLLSRLGAGAFGEVYLAEQESGAGFRRKVALKVLNREVAGIREVGRRMRDEARILGHLAHRNIVAVLDLVHLGDRWAIVMDHVPGADLEHIVKELDRQGHTVPVPAAIDVAVSILRALDAAFHAIDDNGSPLGVVHRDVKPSNVRLTPDGEVKVLDFGVAQFNLDTRESQTKNPGWMGTELYMSPERILNEGDTAAGDVYATAATLVELLRGSPLGRTPVLPERHEPFVEAVLAEIAGAVEGPAHAVEQVLATLRQMLHVVPDRRPTARDAADALEALSRSIEGEPLRPFARRVVPAVEAQISRSRSAASGIFEEGTVPGERDARLVAPSPGTQSVPTEWTNRPVTAELRERVGRMPEEQRALLAGGLFAAVALVGIGGAALILFGILLVAFLG
ncbi:MAG: serine/threonine protein kinase [Myxococcales bacterium]|nr:serine/threonine protein kinase [Myxococcales bacterium]